MLQTNNNNNNNILYSSQQETEAVIQSHNEEHISIILSHGTHAHVYTLLLLDICPLFSQSAFTNSKPKIAWHNAFSVSNQNVKTLKLNKNH